MTAFTVNQLRQQYTSQFGAQLTAVTETPTGIYNCHGFVFASRRTQIHSADVRMILEDDHYQKIEKENVKPGDIVLFVAPDGDIEHAAIVVEPPSQENALMPKVVGKWGHFLEYAHYANQSLYKFDSLQYYRVEWQ